MKQTSGAFRFGRRSLLFFPVIPSGYPAQYHIKKNTKQNQNQQKSIEFYTMQTPPQVKSGLDLLEIMGPQPPPSRARYFGNASTFKHYAARKGPLIFSQCSLCPAQISHCTFPNPEGTAVQPVNCAFRISEPWYSSRFHLFLFFFIIIFLYFLFQISFMFLFFSFFHISSFIYSIHFFLF